MLVNKTKILPHYAKIINTFEFGHTIKLILYLPIQEKQLIHINLVIR